ncbi:RNA polymerase II transcriptional coactivator [Neocloeon triangulifer]|uniref:RNA polymerase II transcriptional coactivator n=1 Tax=Neocloeon triangulifer TaxID=2078957 RepID=UPI00286F83A9|nr:RNA polymerase II transcriptional coactivator [Neocloeon triangulifer]
MSVLILIRARPLSLFCNFRPARQIVICEASRQDTMPKNKKLESDSSDSDSGPEDRNPAPSKKQKTGGDKQAASSSTKVEGADEPTWALEKMRYVKIREFKGKVYIDIREFYEKDGKELPGKKGISMSAQQYQKFKSIIPEIDEELKKI